ncbi:hypothetical protein SAMN03159448_05479 [Sinorhizobium sp. NFACC03]|nr:hypothetical protein SAMN03159448_05479 [Sinorhizobium sp. NFACC03]
MKEYAGIDVSLEYSSVCVVEADGRIVREAKVLSETDALIAWFGAHGVAMERIDLEAGPAIEAGLKANRSRISNSENLQNDCTGTILQSLKASARV